MISLRTLAGMSGVAVLALTPAACGDATTDPSLAHRPNPIGASFTSSKTVTGTVDARVLLTKSGDAILDVHTGTFVDATNTGTTNGVLSSFTYTVKDGSGHTVVTNTVNLSNSPSSYTAALNLCSNGDDDNNHWGNDDHGSNDDHDSNHDDHGWNDDHWSGSSCSTHFGSGDRLSLTATLKGLGSDGKSSASVSVDAAVLNLPDVDLSHQNIVVVGAGGVQSAATSFVPATPTTYSVSFPNNKALNGVAAAVGVQTVCVVTVDGMPQIALPSAQYNKYTNPNAFGYVGSATQTIAAGASAPCQFTLTLPAGVHKIVVTAAVTAPGDYDFTNNSTASVSLITAAAVIPNIPVDLVASPIQRVGNGLNAATITTVDTTAAGNTVTLRSVIQNSTVSASAVDCTISADPTLKPTAVGATTNIAVPAGGTGTCQYTLTTAGLGSFPVSISVTPSAGSPVDPSTANNAASATLKVVSGGRFSSIDLTSIGIQQQWFNLLASTAFPAESLSLQNVHVNQLALVVVPAQDVIGTFTLKSTVISGTTTFPTGTISGTLHQSASGQRCSDLTAGPNATFTGTPANFPAQIGYFADVCSEPATLNGVSGFQRISVDYVQSLAGSIMNPGAYLLSGTVQVKMELSFTLQGSTTPDKVTATVNITVPAPSNFGVTSLDGTRGLWSQASSAVAVVTP